MKNHLILTTTLLIISACQAHAQKAAEIPADTLASYPGGDAAFEQFILTNLLTTPEALAGHIAGDIELSFVIDEKGFVDEIKPLHKMGYGCEEQAIRVLRLMPRWQPGVIAGRRIKTSLQHTFHFSADMKVNEGSTVVSRDMLPDVASQFGKEAGDLASYISTHYVYPAHAPRNPDEAIVLRLKVNEEGAVSDIQLVTGLGKDFDDEAIRVISAMPRWQPQRANFKPVSSYKDIVIGFKKKTALLY